MNEMDAASIVGLISNHSVPLTFTLIGAATAGLAKVATTFSASSVVTAGWVISAGSAMGPVTFKKLLVTAVAAGSCCTTAPSRALFNLIFVPLYAAAALAGSRLKFLASSPTAAWSLAWSTRTTASMGEPPV